MEEQRPEQQDAEQEQPVAGEQAGAERQRGPELLAELQELGSQIEATFRAFVAGPGKTIQRDLTSAFQDLGSQIQKTAKSVQQRAEGSDLQQRARSAVQKIQESPVVKEFEETLVNGVQQLSQQLRRLAERIETRDKPVDESAPEQSQSPGIQRLTVETDDSAEGTGKE
jgi:hypothetical protein